LDTACSQAPPAKRRPLLLRREQQRGTDRNSEPGFGPLTAVKLVGEIAGASRFSNDANPARAAGLAPIPVSP
jgi:transposase